MSVLKESRHLKMSLKEIKIATENFKECIGKGGYGMVYKGELSVHGKPTTVAVKRLNQQPGPSGQGLKEFLMEIQLLTGQNHPNLISLFGYCDEGNEKIIVYEYAQNGSLDKYLTRNNPTRVLSWLERLKICVDAARGLSHLHNHVGKHQAIIHRDIKSSNILLDHNWVAKISDLGLSKLTLAGLNRSCVISYACGTHAYCEPEYMFTGIVRKESDVYSFGMVLFEVICGRVCFMKDDDGFSLSAQLVKDYHKKKKLNMIVDPALSDQMRFKSMGIFLSIAYQCLHDDRELRPTMNVVVEELEHLQKLELLSCALEDSSTMSSSMVKVAMAVVVVRIAVSKLSDAIRYVMKKTWEFKSQLTQIEETIREIKPIINNRQKLNEVLDRPEEEIDMFMGQLKGAEHLALKCEHIELNFYKRYRQSLKLDGLNASLLQFFRIDVQLQEARDVKEVLQVVKDVQKRMKKHSFRGWSPLLKGAVIGFDDQVSTLKQLVFRNSSLNDCSVVVVAAAGGCGKTTLVTKFCHDPDVQGKFRRHIYFATISNNPNLKVIIKNLIQKNKGGQPSDFTSDDDAIHQWVSFMGENKSEVLLVLDDVWDASIVTAFKVKSPGYKILVTSRSTFAQFRTYQVGPLNDYDSTNLFRNSAFSKGGSKCCCIPNDLVYKLVKCCKRHPLTLSVIGGLLKGTHMLTWHVMLNKLWEGPKSVQELDEDMRLLLARSLDVLKKGSEIKECYMDLALFPENQKIAATTLMDIWISLYKHDEKGFATLNNLFELSFKNLATLLPIRKDSFVIDNYCNKIVVMQHDMMRMLAINISSQEPAEHRKRLIINAKGQDLPELPQTINARLMSISTDEAFCFKWNDIRAPKVEVLVLNFMSKIYTFPLFMQNMESLTVLIITNYGYYFSDLHNFPAPQFLSRLTSIRLEHVSISSISTSILGLVKLQRLSLIMCKVGNTFDETNLEVPNKFPSLLELDIDSCDDLLTFPTWLGNLVHLKKLSITNCHELISLSEGFKNLANLEVLSLVSCSNLKFLPESMSKLQKLSIIDLSHCSHLCILPTEIGKLVSLRTIHMRGCTGLHELPVSVKDLCLVEVICNKETSLLWSHLKDVKVQVIEEDE